MHEEELPNKRHHSTDELLPVVYEELRKLAAANIARESPGQTLSATALVHEAYQKLADRDGAPQWENVGHFFGAAAEAMRRILIDTARRKQALRHGGANRKVEFCSFELGGESQITGHIELLDFHEALKSYEHVYPKKAKLVEIRFFAGLSVKQAAEAMGISESTAKRYWNFSRAWLSEKLNQY